MNFDIVRKGPHVVLLTSEGNRLKAAHEALKELTSKALITCTAETFEVAG